MFHHSSFSVNSFSVNSWLIDSGSLASAIDGNGYCRENTNMIRPVFSAGVRQKTETTERLAQDQTVRFFIEHNDRISSRETDRKETHRTARTRQRNTTRH